jgi:hypothetical protein
MIAILNLAALYLENVKLEQLLIAMTTMLALKISVSLVTDVKEFLSLVTTEMLAPSILVTPILDVSTLLSPVTIAMYAPMILAILLLDVTLLLFLCHLETNVWEFTVILRSELSELKLDVLLPVLLDVTLYRDV